MEAKELRIGNWFNEFGIPKQADANLISKLEKINDRGKIAIDVSPIPLTPEILETAGFEKDFEGDYIKCFNGRVYYFGNGFLMKDYSIKTNLNQFKIRYLHQLQNLYFALTGEELKIEL